MLPFNNLCSDVLFAILKENNTRTSAYDKFVFH